MNSEIRVPTRSSAHSANASPANVEAGAPAGTSQAAITTLAAPSTARAPLAHAPASSRRNTQTNMANRQNRQGAIIKGVGGAVIGGLGGAMTLSPIQFVQDMGHTLLSGGIGMVTHGMDSAASSLLEPNGIPRKLVKIGAPLGLGVIAAGVSQISSRIGNELGADLGGAALGHGIGNICDAVFGPIQRPNTNALVKGAAGTVLLCVGAGLNSLQATHVIGRAGMGAGVTIAGSALSEQLAGRMVETARDSEANPEAVAAPENELAAMEDPANVGSRAPTVPEPVRRDLAVAYPGGSGLPDTVPVIGTAFQREGRPRAADV